MLENDQMTYPYHLTTFDVLNASCQIVLGIRQTYIYQEQQKFRFE